jgi:hypothetical protein
MSHSTIPTLILNSLKTESYLATKLGNRIHYQTIPQTSKYPHIYFTRQSTDFEELMDPGERGLQTDRYILELVAERFDGEMLNRINSCLSAIEGQIEGLTIYVSEVSDVDDQYEFRSADSDALFVHGFTVQVYFSED